MRILIIRHAEPDYAADSLTPKGFREAELLSQRLCKTKIDDFYCSPLGRAVATAKPTLEKLGKEAVILPWIREFSGYVVYQDGKKKIPWNLPPRYWTSYPELYDTHTWLNQELIKSGTSESVYNDMCAQLDKLLESYGYTRDGLIYKCQENKDITIVLFCHFAMGMAILSHFSGISPSLLWQSLFLPTSSVTTLITEERVPGEVFFKCMQVGDTSHLYANDEPVSHSGLYPEFANDEKREGAQA